MEDVPDPRTEQEGICGVTVFSPSGREWVCILKVHAKIYQRRNGALSFDNNPRADRHWFVNRWPNRKYDNNDAS